MCQQADRERTASRGSLFGEVRRRTAEMVRTYSKYNNNAASLRDAQDWSRRDSATGTAPGQTDGEQASARSPSNELSEDK